MNDIEKKMEALKAEFLVKLEALEKEAEMQKKQEEPKPWKPEYGEEYFYIGIGFTIDSWENVDDDTDKRNFRIGNCFPTEERAEQVARKIRLLLQLEQLHDMLCPDYVPDYEDDDEVTVDVPLSDIAKLEVQDGFNSIDRINQTRYITVSAAVEEGYNATLLSRELIPLLEKYEAPDRYNIDLGGETESVNEMLEQMGLMILMGLAFIYLIMVAQFQSLLSPFIILFTVPLAFTGGLIALWVTGEQISVMAMMGLVVLLGTVVNNGIVFVDYTNQLRKGGMERRAALVATGKTRMRPILMTAMTTILAEASMIFGDDMASQMGKGMALVIVGGLAYATLMTLYIIPVMYDILFKKAPLDVDTGSENLDDVPDDAQEFIRQALPQGISLQAPESEKRRKKTKKKGKIAAGSNSVIRKEDDAEKSAGGNAKSEEAVLEFLDLNAQTNAGRPIENEGSVEKKEN